MRYTQPITLAPRGQDSLSFFLAPGGLTLDNRFLMAPVKTAYGTTAGRVTSRHLTYYANIARGGVSLVILEPVAVSPSGKEHPKQLTIHLDSSVSDLKRIIDVLHGQGTKACLNLNHAGRAANPKATGGPPLAPSAVTCPTTGQTPLELTEAQIEQIVADFGEASKRAREAGFDAIEIQCGHGYLVSQFLSPRTNLREDAYGKDRTLFLRRLFETVQQHRGQMAVFVRISVSEFTDGGLTAADNRPILELAERSGFDAVHCGMGSICDSPAWYYAHMAVPEQRQIEALRAVRNMTSLPLIAAGRMADMDKLALLEREDLADLVAFGRALVADPELPRKLAENRADDALFCGFCLQGCLTNVKNGKGLGCIVNPTIDAAPHAKSLEGKNVAVVGGGPAGMSSACTLAELGASVILFEKESRLGGQFRLAPSAPHKETMARPLAGLVHRTEKLVGDIRVGTTFQPEDAAGFDAVVVATGSFQNLPQIAGLDRQYSMTSLEFFEGRKKIEGRRVLVIGAGMVGMEAAELLVDRGCEVTATKRTDTIANDMEMVTKKLMLRRLADNPLMTILPETTVLAFEQEGVRIRRNDEEQLLPPFDTVILASGMKPASDLAAALEKASVEAKLVGDAAHPADIFAATQGGYHAALDLAGRG